MSEDPLRAAVDETIAGHAEQVCHWTENRPGAWGHLAAKGILAYKRRLGRPLAEAERRALWAALWESLEAKRSRF